jgi:chemotaxis response regulator CheB
VVPCSDHAESVITVLLVDHPARVRRALRESLSREAVVRVVGEAGRPAWALRLAQTLRPDVVLVDAEMPGLDLPDVVRGLGVRSPDSVLLVVALEPDRLARAALDGRQNRPRVRVIGKTEGVAALLTLIRQVGLGRS